MINLFSLTQLQKSIGCSCSGTRSWNSNDFLFYFLISLFFSFFFFFSFLWISLSFSLYSVSGIKLHGHNLVIGSLQVRLKVKCVASIWNVTIFSFEIIHNFDYLEALYNENFFEDKIWKKKRKKKKKEEKKEKKKEKRKKERK